MGFIQFLEIENLHTGMLLVLFDEEIKFVPLESTENIEP